MLDEVWRVVPSQPWCLASSDGRIMVIPYIAEMPNGQGFRQYGGKPHFGVWNKQDDRFITVYKGQTYKIARLVCEAFNGAPTSDRKVCMHLDENPANNRPWNLAWGTQKENLNAPHFIEYCKSRTGENSPGFKGRARLAKARSDDNA
jgi:hypothetical protein